MKKPRPVRIEGDVAYVTLTKGYVAVVDSEDATLAAGWNWSAHVSKRKDGSVRSVYATRNRRLPGGGQEHVFLHRVIMGAPHGVDIDHRDCDGLNNRRYNLRLATKAQNCQNQSLRADNSSGARGVSWHKQCGKWHATIQASGRRQSLGLFDRFEDASVAYALASQQKHGEFGRVQ